MPITTIPTVSLPASSPGVGQAFRRYRPRHRPQPDPAACLSAEAHIKYGDRCLASIGVCKASWTASPDSVPNRETACIPQRRRPAEIPPGRESLARKNLRLPAKKILLSVGHLVERKGHHITIEALTTLPQDVFLVIAGPAQNAYRWRHSPANCASPKKSVSPVSLKTANYAVGTVPPTCLSCAQAAKAGPMSSSNQWPAERPSSLPRSGIPEVVSTPVAGRLMDDRTPAALALSYTSLFADYPSRKDVRAHAEKYSWEATTASQLALFRSMTGA